MKFVSMVQTADGCLHKDAREARRHLEKLIADEISLHAHSLHGKSWQLIGDYLYQNTERFEKLLALKNDLLMTPTEETDL